MNPNSSFIPGEPLVLSVGLPTASFLPLSVITRTTVSSDCFRWTPDASPTWTRAQIGIEVRFGPRRTGRPWSIRVCRVDSHETEQAFRASEGQGSVFRELASVDQLLWGAQ